LDPSGKSAVVNAKVEREILVAVVAGVIVSVGTVFCEPDTEVHPEQNTMAHTTNAILNHNDLCMNIPVCPDTGNKLPDSPVNFFICFVPATSLHLMLVSKNQKNSLMLD